MVRVVVPLAAALLLVGCGSAEPESAPATPTTTTSPATTAPPTTTEPAPTTTETQPPPPKPKALPGVPGYTAGYENWTKLNAKPIPPRESGDAHLGTKNVFTTREDANGRYPNGTIIVKEASPPGKDFIGLIAIMRKQKGADPEHNDWVFVEYTREGPDARFGETASGAVCYGCHVGAQATDYVWIATLGLTK